MGKLWLMLVLYSVLVAGPVLGQDDFSFSGPKEEASERSAKAESPAGWEFRFQAGAHNHLARDDFWDSQRGLGVNETRWWLSWDLGLVHRQKHGWGLGAFFWIGGSYDRVWGLKGYRQWRLDPDRKFYVQAGPGLILYADTLEQDYQVPGLVLEFEAGTDLLALCTSMTAMPYEGRNRQEVWDGTHFSLDAGEKGTDVVWNAGLKLGGPLGGLGTLVAVVAAAVAFDSFNWN